MARVTAVGDEPLHRALGLTDDELVSIEGILGRAPNHLELAMFAVMWSEHCSYKSSRVHLRRLPSEAAWVLVGPGEGAGVVDVGDGIAAAIRIESHNHPSAVEPYQGAATGVGGILRDVFSVGARPIAVMDPLRFGPLDDARSRWIAEGVVSGISGYGNAVGVPTVGGEVVFDETYADNPLVNVLCLGILPADRLVLARATGVGNLAVLFGSSTGRDGIGGASVLASAGFGEDDSAKRPSVQVGDPFEEKRLIEACLALLDAGLAVGVQDLGAAGITGATSETAAKGGAGLDVYLSEVRVREPNMEPFEIMTSESQERMLAIVKPEHLDEVVAICDRWEVSAAVIGTVTGTGRLRVLDRLDGDVLADLPAKSLDEDAPRYDRPMQAPAMPPPLPAPISEPEAHVLSQLADSSWVWSQYDHQLFLNTVVGPGADATVLRLKHPTTGVDTGRALALTTDGNHRWCAADPRVGTSWLVAEAALNLACVGARPLALVNCLNFGNPEHPEVMWQLSEAIDGMGDACRALGIPVVGGNVSLYNESRGRDIDPTPIVGMLGIIDALTERPPVVALSEGSTLVVLGPRAGSPLDYAVHRSVCQLVAEVVNVGLVDGVHDVSDGGLAVALAEMAVRAGVGFAAKAADALVESPSRVVVSVPAHNVPELHRRHVEAGVVAAIIGTAGGHQLVIEGVIDLALDDAVSAWRDRLPTALGAGTAQ